MNPTYVTFGLYILVMAGIGIYFYRQAAGSVEDYLLGGRSMGSWVTAFSAQASDMSGWLLMGLPGAVFLYGLGECWIAIGLLVGTLLNWLFVASRLRIFTEMTKSLTLPSFFGTRFADPTRLIRVVSALLTLFFFTVYAASGLAGAGKLFESMFGFDYSVAVLTGMAVMLFYTILGGFLAVCWTDLLQGILMFFAIVILPIVVWQTLPDGAVAEASLARGISLKLLPSNWNFMTLVGIFSTAAWGFGYFGQPHILSRFMSIKSVKLMPRTITIAMTWVVISLTGAVCIGLLAIPLYPGDVSDPERVFIYMIERFCHPMLSGILFAAILAAIMSTIDSQLLASSSTLVEDIYGFLFRSKAGRKEQMVVSRLSVLLISVIAAILALNPNQTIFSLVKFAWGGLGAVFGPAVLMALYWRKASFIGILLGMVIGTAVLLGWYYCGLGSVLYEIVPGFAANILCIWFFSLCFPASEEVKKSFDLMLKNLKDALR